MMPVGLQDCGDVSVGCQECRIAWDVGCMGCGMSVLWDARDAGCGDCRMREDSGVMLWDAGIWDEW